MTHESSARDSSNLSENSFQSQVSLSENALSHARRRVRRAVRADSFPRQNPGAFWNWHGFHGDKVQLNF